MPGVRQTLEIHFNYIDHSCLHNEFVKFLVQTFKSPYLKGF